MPEDRSVLGRPAPAPRQTWHYGPGDDRAADLYLPDGAPDDASGPGVPLALVHGGYWRPEYDRTHLRPLAAALATAGHPTLLVGYSRVPGDPDVTLDDLREALAGAAPVLPGGAPILVGHSAGGHLALLLAADPDVRIRACLALAPVADLMAADRLGLDGGAVREFLGAPATTRPDLDPARQPPTVPVTVLHGEADTLVPEQLSAAYGEATGARLVRLPGVGHFELIDPLSGAWPSVIAELDALAAATGIE